MSVGHSLTLSGIGTYGSESLKIGKPENLADAFVGPVYSQPLNCTGRPHTFHTTVPGLRCFDNLLGQGIVQEGSHLIARLTARVSPHVNA
jgi:hypothetical protein